MKHSNVVNLSNIREEIAKKGFETVERVIKLFEDKGLYGQGLLTRIKLFEVKYLDLTKVNINESIAEEGYLYTHFAQSVYGVRDGHRYLMLQVDYTHGENIDECILYNNEPNPFLKIHGLIIGEHPFDGLLLELGELVKDTDRYQLNYRRIHEGVNHYTVSIKTTDGVLNLTFLINEGMEL